MVNDNLAKFSVLITLFITLLVGIVLLQPISNESVGTRTKGVITNETLTIASGAGQTTNVGFEVESVQGFGNSTVSDQTITEITTRVNFTNPGVITVNNTRYVDGNYIINYTYLPTGYVQGSSVSQTLVGLIPLFFALGILAIAIMGMTGMFGDFLRKN